MSDILMLKIVSSYLLRVFKYSFFFFCSIHKMVDPTLEFIYLFYLRNTHTHIYMGKGDEIKEYTYTPTPKPYALNLLFG